MLFVPIILILAIVVFLIITEWRIFEKAGQPGWACIVPIYNIIILLAIAGKPWWWIFLMCIPFAGIIFTIIVYHNISLNFGKDAGFTVGIVLLPIVFLPILAFGDAKYKGKGPVSTDNRPIDQV